MSAVSMLVESSAWLLLPLALRWVRAVPACPSTWLTATGYRTSVLYQYQNCAYQCSTIIHLR